MINEFLSHLCGEEGTSSGPSMLSKFLSHLCGEEEWGKGSPSPIVFLSHLCGEEEELYLKKFSYNKAWRSKYPILPSIFHSVVTG